MLSPSVTVNDGRENRSGALEVLEKAFRATNVTWYTSVWWRQRKVTGGWFR